MSYSEDILATSLNSKNSKDEWKSPIQFLSNSNQLPLNDNQNTNDHFENITDDNVPEVINLSISLIDFFQGSDNGLRSVSTCKWLVICTSCLFISLISWDMVGDKEGFYRGLWIPSSGLGIMMILWLVNRFKLELLLRFNNSRLIKNIIVI